MHKHEFNFEDFIENVKDMNYNDIMNYGNTIVTESESLLKSYHEAGMDVNMELKQYSEKIKAFLSFISQGIKPKFISAHDFKLYRIVVEYLVAKEQMKPEAIDVFIRSK